MTESQIFEREIAALQCQNTYQRYYLAELLVRSGDFSGAVAELESLYERGVNDLETRLFNVKNALNPIVSSEAYAASSLPAKIAARRAVAEERQARFGARLAELSDSERPPPVYISKGVCPFECCSYGKWSVIEDTVLLASPDSRDKVGTARSGESVEGVTGDVHLTPIPVAVLHPVPLPGAGGATFEAGEIVFLLDYIGEGYRNVWHRGVVHQISTYSEVRDRCVFPSADCWGEYLVPEEQRSEHVWWVKVRQSGGTESWTNEIHFDGIDGCG